MLAVPAVGAYDSNGAAMDTPYVTLHLDSVASTQDEARRAYADTPLLVTADRQTAGRGRSGREWLEAPRALFASLAFAPEWPVADRPALSLLAGVSARAALGGRVGLKWPNDLLDGTGAKVGGLLAETSSADAPVVIGLGVNLWWPDAPAGMGAVHPDDPGPDAARRLAGGWAADVLDRAGRGPVGWGLDEYRAGCVTLGAVVRWDGGGPARAVAVAADGSLVVETEHGPQRLTAGEVRHMQAATLPRRSNAAPEVEP